ncbi:MAG: hypothetical protein K2X47_04875 [Bdellovibrionales bacterium]|nr:hypothetical protein [Bdellovibrionales bacterium]
MFLRGMLFAFLIYVLSPIAFAAVEKINGTESLPSAVSAMLFEEQILHNKALWSKGAFASDISPEYIPENRPKFPLGYFLIPSENSDFLATSGAKLSVRRQVSQKTAGKTFHRLFVHPESLEHYRYLSKKYQYVGPEETEFYASPTSSYRSLIVWQPRNPRATPFVAKVSLARNVIGNIDRLVSNNEVQRSIANQKVFEKIGDEALADMGVRIYPESMGLMPKLDSSINAPEKTGGQLIREIPADVVSGKVKWLSFSGVMSPAREGEAAIFAIQKATGLDWMRFIRTYFVNSYMDMFENLTFKKGINFEPHSQNLSWELDTQMRPTGNWVIRDFGGVWPDVFRMMKGNVDVNAYAGPGSVGTHKLVGGMANAVSSYVFFYRRQVFDMLCKEIRKKVPGLSEENVAQLRAELDARFLLLVETYYGIRMKTAPTMDNYQDVSRRVLERTQFDKNALNAQKVNAASHLSILKEKDAGQEWIGLSSDSNGEPFSATSVVDSPREKLTLWKNESALFAVGPKNNVVGLALLTPQESATLKQSPLKDVGISKASPARANASVMSCGKLAVGG